MTDYRCPICSGTPVVYEPFSTLPRVTSDSKTWPAGGQIASCSDCGFVHKPATPTLLKEAEDIYAAYQMFELIDGADQAIFDASGNASPRSHKLIEFLTARPDLPAKGSLIDIGCGNGTALGAMSASLPDWVFFGNDLTEDPRAYLSSLPNFGDYFAGPLERAPGTFDVVSLLHSLGHIERPVSDMLQLATNMLPPDGHVLVATPDLETSPFDILITDNRAHFTRATLRHLAIRSGLSPNFLGNDVLPKEITMWAQKTDQLVTEEPPSASAGAQLLHTNAVWLEDVIASARKLRSNTKNFGIFGTAISAVWMFGALDGQVEFFVDEDPLRVGKELEGRPIISPASIPDDAKVFLPLAPVIAGSIAARLRNDGALVRPPDFPAPR